jgi:hypothetical protein
MIGFSGDYAGPPPMADSFPPTGGKIRYTESYSVIFAGAARSVQQYASTVSREKRARWPAERILSGVLAAVADADVRYGGMVLAIRLARYGACVAKMKTWLAWLADRPAAGCRPHCVLGRLHDGA